MREGGTTAALPESEEAGVEPATGRTSEEGEEETGTQGTHLQDTTPTTEVAGESKYSEQYLGTYLYLVHYFRLPFVTTHIH